MGKPNNPKSKLDGFKIFLIVMAVIGLVITGFVYLFYRSHFPTLTDDNELWANFGDFVGGTLSSIFSFFTFIAILYTLHLQREEFRLNRVELQTGNEEAEKQTKIARNQLENSIRQKNEEYLLEFMQVYLMLESEIRHTHFDGIIGAELLANFLNSENKITVTDRSLRRQDHYELPTKPILKYLNCLEYLIYWDALQFINETNYGIPLAKHKSFSSQYSPFIRSFCSNDTFLNLQKSAVLLRLNIAAQFPNIGRFI